ncbi:GAF domain-containing protein [Alteromonas sp. H39]|uniref:GAF domain-containing protein n=1 Tax=Alteromonas sp. H39 TaxID=3389876 RepID=UPI0039E09F4B
MSDAKHAQLSSTDIVANCEKEQLHLSGQIQNFGALLVADSESMQIRYVSDNTNDILGIKAETLVGQSLSEQTWFDTALCSEVGRSEGARVCRFDHRIGSKKVNLRVLRGENTFVVEAEPVNLQGSNWSLSELRAILYPPTHTEWKAKDYWEKLLTAISSVLPFHRLLLYRFEDDWTGEVISEHARKDDVEYLGLKFPASDIPQIARKMYFENPSRLIDHVDQPPVDILGDSDTPPDLTWSDLRSVSPVHAQYLRNMGITTSFSIPVILSGNLWGIVSCHHPSHLHVDAQSRYQSEQLVKHFCSIYATFLSRQRLSLLSTIDDKINSITAQMSLLDGSGEALTLLLNETTVTCSGTFSAVVMNGSWTCSTGDADIPLLNKIDKYFRQDTSDYILSNTNIRLLQGLEAIDEGDVRGVMVIKLDHSRDNTRLYIFRRPEKQLVEWAGNPDKSKAQVSETGSLSPRQSFEKWTEVKGEASLPWSKSDFLFAKKARVGLMRFFNQIRSNHV